MKDSSRKTSQKYQWNQVSIILLHWFEKYVLLIKQKDFCIYGESYYDIQMHKQKFLHNQKHKEQKGFTNLMIFDQIEKTLHTEDECNKLLDIFVHSTHNKKSILFWNMSILANSHYRTFLCYESSSNECELSKASCHLQSEDICIKKRESSQVVFLFQHIWQENKKYYFLDWFAIPNVLFLQTRKNFMSSSCYQNSIFSLRSIISALCV